MTSSTILFADICGSTSLYERLGDDLAESVISSCLAVLTEIVNAQQGVVLEQIGDEIMCQFNDASHAVMAAGDMHQCTRSQKFGHNPQSVSIRIGAHTGAVIHVDSGVQGDTVNVAARIAALARAGKSMISEQTYDALPDALKSSCRYMLETQLKGKEQLVNVYEAVWETNEQLTRVACIKRSENKHEIVLKYKNQSVSLSKGALSIGRASDGGLCVSSTQASRKHCEIRMNGNKFTLYDNSTNGTFVVQNDVEMFFHHESAPLHQSGLISLGQSRKESDNSELIHFTIQSSS